MRKTRFSPNNQDSAFFVCWFCYSIYESEWEFLAQRTDFSHFSEKWLYIYIVLLFFNPLFICCFFLPERIFKHCNLTARGCLGSLKGLQKWKVQTICDRSCIPLLFLGWSERKVATSWSLKSFWGPIFLKLFSKLELLR